ncbi:MAG TPA: TylF/MycF/NovP-related O-methyltransferase [Agriterribacter sp.]|uniref:TylF/MycF/NovP-related O-methyltransferase n=1 Tax=Agriterribacter sp. TaxID=2821509 RepID=UPI002D093D5C|nr:TylF/MycF/NovP-related O-methyltransferase [Agriterribacter sp.]HRQ17716.1 TylF/MycF/NovP-related O-methyltransferase [Agriterribacter sp.]
MTLITEDRLKEIVRLAGIAPNGTMAEVGVYRGGSLKYLADAFPSRTIWGFDTFTGLPKEQWSEGEIHKPGDFSDTSFEAVSEYLKGNKNVTLIEGMFPDSFPLCEYGDIPFAFVHVDTDFYLSVKKAISFFYPLLYKGGIMVFDDFGWPHTPGVEQALSESGLQYQPTKAKYQAYIQKPY